MPPVFQEHPLRRVVTAELHARTFQPLRAPERVAYLAVVCGEQGIERNVEHLKRLLEHYGRPIPETVDRHYSADLGPMRMRWERHTEFVTYTFSRQGAYEHPFAAPLLHDLPEAWLRELPGEVISAAAMAIDACAMPERNSDELAEFFSGNAVIGSEAVGGLARIWSDFRIDDDGFVRILVRDCSLSKNQAGRLAKRILDLNCYRALALLGFPLAREVSATLSDADRRLALLSSRMSAPGAAAGRAFESELLAELTNLAAEIEDVSARTTYRFDASRAYYAMVRQRLEQLRQQRIEGLQTFTEFLEARLAPALATCESTQQRQTDLAERAARLTSLLRARVDVSLQEQNRQLLESMDRRAHIQLRLQETVEGLSVIAIGYYGVGLIGYALKGLEDGGVPINATLAMGIAVPLVLGFAWLGLRRVKKHLSGSV
ncbi:DUF3422 family protein [uncultured Thiodictyon sp.]|jgi:uncharacterized membrane-anchored protein|uniref:DUF3422 family protein n=1 Tax=uncultured Thiodictyon sp. TaxID=1846217 RepID=UPI0025FF5AAC|nr:DUF3422 domain-containing protein [uncultured Thiodictyon sp.]